MLYIGTAAWSIPKEFKSSFPEQGSHLERYAQTLNAVEINSSFYKDHKPATFERWAETVPENFRFSVKLSKIISHEMKLEVETEVIEEKLSPILKLGSKLGCVLIQIPPKLEFRSALADEFFSNLRSLYQGPVAFEPRHESWGQRGAERIFEKYSVSQVIADPELYDHEIVSNRSFSGVSYYRLHGSPEMYRSNYELSSLENYAHEIRDDFTRGIAHSWCIFDNTTFGFATQNAVDLKRLLFVSRSPEYTLNSSHA